MLISHFARLLAALAAALALAGCSCFGLCVSPKPPPLDCVTLDVSASTNRVRTQYVSAFRQLATSLSGRNGRICLLLAGGDETETHPFVASLAPQDPSNGLLAGAERKQQVAAVTAQFQQLITHPPLDNRYSALVESFVPASETVQPGGEILLLSDGIENSSLMDFYHEDLSSQGISALLDRLQHDQLLPDLHGVTVAIPFPLYDGPGGSHLSPVRQREISDFWRAWAARTGARLLWQRQGQAG